MLDEPTPGATLEAPETFRVLLAPLWLRLPLAVGYRGPARWVALYISSDHVIYNDGAGSASGDTGLFLAYKRHPAVAQHLAGAHLGGTNDEAREWLLVDQAQLLLYQGLSPLLSACIKIETSLQPKQLSNVLGKGPPGFTCTPFLRGQLPRGVIHEENTTTQAPGLLSEKGGT